jgi:hypothetical protein
VSGDLVSPPPGAIPLPGSAPAVVAAEAPGSGVGHWAGGPSAVVGHHGDVIVGYRVRHGARDRSENVIARSRADGTLEPLLVLGQERWDAMAMEKPALVPRPDGGWTLFVCLASRTSKAWWIERLDADTLEGLAGAESVRTLDRDAQTAVKDPIVELRDGVWTAWVCCHWLQDPGEEDRMSTAIATSEDGWTWTWQGTVLAPREGEWDARGVRITTVLADGRAAYDGRRPAAEDWHERIGLARWDGERFVPDPGPVADARYLTALELPGGGIRTWYERRRGDGTHDLVTELVPA